MGAESACCGGGTDEALAAEMKKLRERQGSMHPEFGMAPIPLKNDQRQGDDDSIVDSSFFSKNQEDKHAKNIEVLQMLEQQCQTIISQSESLTKSPNSRPKEK